MDIEALGDVGADGVEDAFVSNFWPRLTMLASASLLADDERFLRDDRPSSRLGVTKWR